MWESDESARSSEGRFSVLAPTGRVVRLSLKPTAALATLNGRTICELWDMVFRGDDMFPIIRKELSTRFPGVRFMPYERFGSIYGPGGSEVLEALPRLLRELGCDAVIAGVGG